MNGKIFNNFIINGQKQLLNYLGFEIINYLSNFHT